MKLQKSMSLFILIILAVVEHNMVMSLNHLLHSKLIRGLEKIRKRQQQQQNEESHAYPLPTEACFTIEQLEAYKEQFTSFIDKNDDGKASKNEVIKYLQKYNTDVSDKQARKFLERRDTNGDGKVDFIPDYLSEMASPSYGVTTAKEWFDLEDIDRDGFVTREELIEIAEKIGMPQEEAEETVEGFYMGADSDGDGKLSWKEYSTLFMD